MRAPRIASAVSSAGAQSPRSKAAPRTIRQARAPAITAPRTRSACPPQYLVSGTTETSTPRASGVRSPGDPQALSMTVKSGPSRPDSAARDSAARAAATMAGTSCTSKVKLPGLSRNIIRVLGRI